MDLLVVCLRAVLAAVLVVSAVAKLLDLPGSRTALRRFGVPARLVVASAVGLPVVELIIAALLAFSVTVVTGAIGASALFMVFTAGIANQLRQGQAPPCHCFGALSSEPVSGRTIARNAALLGLAVVTAILGWQSPGPGVDALPGLPGATLALLATGVVGTVLAAAAWRQARQVLAAHDALVAGIDRVVATLVPPPIAAGSSPTFRPAAPVTGMGTAPPVVADVQLTSLDGNLISTHSGPDGRTLGLLLTAETCTACHSLLPEVAGWQRDLSAVMDLVLVGYAVGDAYRATIERHGINRAALPDASRYNEVMDSAGAQAVPSLLVIGADGRLARPVAGGVDAIRAVNADLRANVPAAQGSEAELTPGIPAISAEPVVPETPPIGTPVARMLLSAADGTPTDLSLVAGETDLTLLVFWRADCPHCQQLAPMVRAWRDGLDPDRIQVIAITPGDPTAVAMLGISDRTLADPDHAAHDRFGAIGSPSGILLDRQGRVASGLVAGARELELALKHIRGPLVGTSAGRDPSPLGAPLSA